MTLLEAVEQTIKHNTDRIGLMKRLMKSASKEEIYNLDKQAEHSELVVKVLKAIIERADTA